MMEVIYNGISESDSSIGDDAFLLRSYIDCSPQIYGAAEIGNGLEIVDVNVDQLNCVYTSRSVVDGPFAA